MNKRNNDTKTGQARPVKRHKPAGRSPDRPRFKIPLIEQWLLVFLRSGRHFFYNTTTKESVWEAPEHVVEFLFDNVDQNLVLVLLARARGLRKKDDVYWRSGIDTLYDRIIPAKGEVKADVKTPTETKELTAETRAPEPEEHESDESEFSSSDESDGEDNGIDFSALISDDEDNEADSETVLGPPETSVNTFKELLASYDVNPFSTWDKELEKVVNDDRYEVLETRTDRETVFNAWCKETIKARKAAKQEEKSAEDDEDEELEIDVSPAEEFVMLLKDTYKKNKFYVEYRRKNKNDPRFMGIDLTDKERESVYRAYSKVAGSKKKERKESFLQLLNDNKALISPDTNLTNLHQSISSDIKCMIMEIEDRADILDEFVSQLSSGKIESVEEAKRKRQQRLLYEKAKAAEIERRKADWSVVKGKKKLEKQNQDLEREVKSLGKEGLKSQLR